MQNRIWLHCIAILTFMILNLANIANAGLTKGVVQFHPADETIIYDWFSYVPNSLSKAEMSFITVSLTGGLFDYSENTEQVRLYTENIKSFAETYKLVLITPSVPRTNTPTDIYSIAFDRQCFLSNTDSMYARPDHKVNNMIDWLTDELGKDGYSISKKVFVEGFSAGGMFAQRYALVHPLRVQAVAAGQCGGSLTLPTGHHNGESLTWAIGIDDYKELVGKSFNNLIYNQIPQFIYIGEDDIYNSHFRWANPDGFWSQEKIDYINSLFGDTDPVRVENMTNYMAEIDCNVKFKMYADTGHEIMPWNTPLIYHEIYSFLDQKKDFSFKSYKFSSPLFILLSGE